MHNLLEYGVRRKVKDIKGYQAKILKIGGSIIILHIHKLFNFAVKQGFSRVLP
jgi:hypothetical protein